MLERTILVTGGSGGLGSQLLDFYLRQGNNVIATESGLREGVRNPQVEWVECNLADLSSVRRAVSLIKGRVNRVVHCAAFDPRAYGFTEGGYEGVDLSLRINGVGSFVLLNEILCAGGTDIAVAVIGSEAIYHPDSKSSAYAAGKGALKILTASLSDTARDNGGSVFELILGRLDSDERKQTVKEVAQRWSLTEKDVTARVLARSNPESRLRDFIRADHVCSLLECGFGLGPVANGASFRLDGSAGGAFR